MLKIVTITTLLSICSAVPIQAAEYKIDPSHSFIEFRIQHLGFSWLYGRFNKIDGTLNYDAANPGDANIQLNIDPASVDTNWAERDKHLRNSDFLDVDNFPTASFMSTAYVPNNKGGTLTGQLTLHGVSKEISIDVTKIGEGEDPWGGYRTGFAGTMELNRSDFNISYNLGPASETMQMRLGIEGIRQ